MTVYFVSPRVDPSTVKIGVTANLSKRQAALGGGVPGGVTVLATLPGGQDVESFLHEKFAAYRLNGEWFQRSDEVRDFINDVLNGKKGLIPFEDLNIHKHRRVEEIAAEAVAEAKRMLLVILDREYKGPGDTIEAAFGRIEKRTGLKVHFMLRLRYRPKADIWAGEYLTLKSIYDAQQARAPREMSPRVPARSDARPTPSAFYRVFLSPTASIGQWLSTTADRMEQSYEEKRAVAANPSLVRLADIVAGRKEEGSEG